MIKVSDLAIYPIKSLAAIQLTSSYVHKFGLLYDRRWMLVDPSGLFISQRVCPRMCLINARLVNSGLTIPGIQLETSGKESLMVNISDNKSRIVKVWDDECKAYDAGDEAANWLSDFLQRECRLVYFPDDEIRTVDPLYAKVGDQTAFSDGFPVLLTSQASLDDLNARIERPVSMLRFRPNLVVTGCDAYAEDNWKKIRIGEITFRIVKPCSRCSIPGIDPETAKKDPAVLKALNNYRKRDNKIYFGQNVIADSEGYIETGMNVTVLE